MSNKREAKLWKELDWLRVLLAIFATVLLIVAYFSIVEWKAIESTWREFLLSIIANLIPAPLVFVCAYIAFRRIEELRSERDADELADKVVQRLNKIAKVQTTTSGESNNFLDTPIQFSELYLQLSRELDVTVKPFEAKSNQQKLIVECTYRGENIIRIRKISYSGSKLSIEDLSNTYTRTNNGQNALIQQGNEKISTGEKYVFDLVLAKKWSKDTIQGWYGKLGYLHFEIEHGEELVDLQEGI